MTERVDPRPGGVTDFLQAPGMNQPIPNARLAYRRQGLSKIANSEDRERMRRFLRSQGVDDSMFPDGIVKSVVKARVQYEVEKNRRAQLNALKKNNQNMLKALGIM